ARIVKSATELGITIFDATRNKANELVHEADLVLIGHVENPFPLMRLSKLFLFPSKWEGFGNALIEALSLGLPALSADCPVGPREILEINRHEAFEACAVKGRGGYLMPVLGSNTALLHETHSVWSAK